MTENLCVRCGKPTADGYACSGCAARAGGQLAQIADLTPDARAVAYGQARASGGGGSGKPGSRSPGNDDALDVLDEVQGTLTTWARHVAEERGTVYALASEADPLQVAAIFLGNRLEWMRHRAEVDEFLGDVERCARRVRGVVEGPAPRKFLGVCGATVAWDDDDNEVPRDKPCDGFVEARLGAKEGTCRACGARWDVAERSKRLDAMARERSYRASEIEDAYGISQNLIRQWATPERALLRVHDRDLLGRARYLLGEVLDLAREQKLKAAERAAKREQRAAREAAEMGA